MIQAEIARDFGILENSVHRWWMQTDIDDGVARSRPPASPQEREPHGALLQAAARSQRLRQPLEAGLSRIRERERQLRPESDMVRPRSSTWPIAGCADDFAKHEFDWRISPNGDHPDAIAAIEVANGGVEARRGHSLLRDITDADGIPHR